MSGKYPLNGSHFTADDDLEMLSHPEDWPALLHVKRGSPASEFAIVEDSGPERIAHRSDGETLWYEDAAAMLADALAGRLASLPVGSCHRCPGPLLPQDRGSGAPAPI